MLLMMLLLPVALLATTTLAQNIIVPGAAWTDTSGNSIQAHGAGILKVRTSITPAYPRACSTTS